KKLDGLNMGKDRNLQTFVLKKNINQPSKPIIISRSLVSFRAVFTNLYDVCRMRNCMPAHFSRTRLQKLHLLLPEEFHVWKSYQWIRLDCDHSCSCLLGERKKTVASNCFDIVVISSCLDIRKLGLWKGQSHTRKSGIDEIIIFKNIFLKRQENTNKNNEIEQLRQGNDRKNIEIRQLRQENSIITESGSVAISMEKLGKGAYGAVYIGNFYGTKVAVKQYHTVILSTYNRKILEREIKIASQCRHPNLLQFICATQNDQDHLVIVTELMDKSLRDLLEQCAGGERTQMENQEVKLTSLDVARGLNYLHSKTPNPIIHRDVSSANVLLWIVNGAIIRAKISDYGSANFLQACKTANPGAPAYAAPEVRNGHQDPKIDVFSYGILVCEISLCEQPDQVEREGQIETIWNVAVKELVKHCTEKDPKQRPTMKQ
ncbi:probable serine threonine- kinase DDB_G0271682, partial [Paramuricea clavata]